MRESKTLEEAKERNMKAKSRVVGIQIETRPDWITADEIKRLRSYDVTRVEIGYQTTIDEINARMGRGTVRSAGEGVQKAWVMRSDNKSKAFTTDWEQLAIAS
jgi:histone acetyltransferase (RNA polymerase elongator complex component)